jgi:hypothetical protein
VMIFFNTSMFAEFAFTTYKPPVAPTSR